MKKHQPDPATLAKLSTMRMVYYGVLLPLVVLSAVVYYLIEAGEMGEPDYSDAPLLQNIAIILIPVCLAAGYFYFKARLSKIDGSLTLSGKLNQYMVLLLIRSAIFEVGFIFCLIAAVLTHVSLFLAAAPIIVFIFILLRPSGSAIAMDLSLTGRQKEQVEGLQ